MSRVVLLDVNVLVALFDPDHVHHELAHDWFADNGATGWATCPITENGFTRVLANPAYGAGISRPESLVSRLKAFCRGTNHHFWPDAVSLTDKRLFNLSAVGGHKHLTDIYLLGLAVKMNGMLATFDRGIPMKAVVGAGPRTLEVVEPAG